MALPAIGSISFQRIQSLQSSFVSSLSNQQKMIMGVAIAALPLLSIAWTVCRKCFHPKTTQQPPVADPATIPQVTKAYLKAHREGIKLLSFEMIAGDALLVEEKKKNILISPLSVSLVLSMLRHGLSTESQEELTKYLFLPQDEDVLKGCAYQLMGDLKAAGFDIANLVYLNEKYRLNPDYLKDVSGAYQSQVLNGSSAEEIN
jgi:serine protease inhibitor